MDGTCDAMQCGPIPEGRPRTFVLIHGAWHGGWCWDRVVALLESAGHRVLAPSLTGLAEKADMAGTDVGLAVHVRDVVDLVVGAELEDVVLCGHSYGGMVITGAVQQCADRVDALVYLDAFLPPAGASVLDLGGPRLQAVVTDLLIPPDRVAIAPFPAAAFRIDPANQAWVDAMCTPQPLATFTEHLDAVDARDRIRSKTYVYAGGYDSPIFAPFRDACLADSAWSVEVLAHGHDLMIDAPEEVARILVEAGRGATGQARSG